MVLIEGQNNNNSNSNNSDLFNKLAISDLIRLGYTYAIFIFVSIFSWS